jgi:transketolase
MAVAQKWLATRYNKPGFEIFDYDVYAVCGDGRLIEGVGSEAALLAGHLGLDNLLYDMENAASDRLRRCGRISAFGGQLE